MTNDNKPLNIATEYYYFKPMCALLYCFTLRAYYDAGCRLVTPVLDLGCADGSFGTLLTRMLDSTVSLVGIDIDINTLKRAKINNFQTYSTLIQSDAKNLPFDDGAFSTIFSNHVFQSITDLPAVTSEIKRVLAPGGQLFCTIQTNLFRKRYLISRLLRKFGCETAAKLYLERIDRRFRQVNISFSPEKWSELFTEQGFKIHKVVGYYPIKLMPLWSLLMWTPMRIIGLLKFLGLDILNRLSTHIQRRIFQNPYLSGIANAKPHECEHILICASK